jgi:hypothetical protein
LREYLKAQIKNKETFIRTLERDISNYQSLANDSNLDSFYLIKSSKCKAMIRDKKKEIQQLKDQLELSENTIRIYKKVGIEMRDNSL